MTSAPSGLLDPMKLMLAAQFAPKRWSAAIRRLAQRSTAPADVLTSEFSTPLNRAPRPLRSLIEACGQTTDPAQTLADILRARSRIVGPWRLLRRLIYPSVICLLSFAITSAILFGLSSALEGSEWANLNWMAMGRPDSSLERHVFSNSLAGIAWSGLFAATLLANVCVIRLAAPGWLQMHLLCATPVVGSTYRRTLLADYLSRLACFLERSGSLERAAEYTADSYRSTIVATVARRIAKDLVAGVSLRVALQSSTLTDNMSSPSTILIENAQSALGERLHSLARFLGDQSHDELRYTVRIAARTLIVLAGLFYLRFALYALLLISSGLPTILPVSWLPSFTSIGVWSNWLALLPVALTNFVLLQAMLYGVDRRRESFASALLRMALIMMVAFACLGGLLRLNFLDLLYVIPIAGVMVSLWRAMRNAQRRVLATALIEATKLDVEPRWIAKAFSVENRGFVRRKARRIGRLLDRGFTCSQALGRSGLFVGIHNRLQLSLAEQFGPESETTADRSSVFQNQSRPTSSVYQEMLVHCRERVAGIAYASLFVIVALVALWTVIQNLSFRAAQAVELETNPDSKVTYDFMETQYAMSPTWRVMYVALLISIVIVALYISPRWIRHRPLCWLIEPILRSWTMAGVSRGLAVQRPLPEVLRSISNIHPVRFFRSRLLRAASAIEAGEPVERALQSQWLIGSRDRQHIQLAKDPQSLSWSLHQIADRDIAKWSSRYTILMDLFFLTTILVVSVWYALIAYYWFSILSQMILFTNPNP